MKYESLDSILERAREILSAQENTLPKILLKEILTNSLKLKEEDLDTLDLKVINRAFRELRYAFKVFKPYRGIRKVSIFGSARLPEEDPHYQQTVKFARMLANEGFMVITGAASGIMKAGNEGAGKGKSFGVNILLPFEQSPNEFIVDDPKLMTFKYFFTRKLLFVMESCAIVLLPGGYGTHDEGFETLTLVQTEKASPRPVVLMDLPGESYWEEWDAFVKDQLLGRGFISREDISLYKIVYSAEEAIDEIKFFFSTYHSMRQVGDRHVIRLERELTDDNVDELNKSFKDVLEKGKFEKTYALPGEVNEPELLRMPRLVFSYNYKSAGRIRQLIDRINEMGRSLGDEV
ncbi:MAG: cytochrome D ubiquinol oxidase subunit II [Candidatus Latescibacteria bacterium]|nr:cytochrome D ubiquinol oxidase subunit II [Candidatus Latescibacterota bacterium]NIM21738.1 cytochrome D ubiquinol oxidase subunit II [Candidatus Latescibacterota bacterium]NIM65876.1 cytochrome D ubiquinol oxidase subunit II [Candidatus Latescibacterota bacterium]NIO02621.1 cytochrome D ubiquinol oxidase subunit II [Candidatus Latescibacterota bacterium]NIO29602.1 cytochrome D ubiquinol oxidase subunit II [Candidatus Latescibacterota bacterium]